MEQAVEGGEYGGIVDFDGETHDPNTSLTYAGIGGLPV